MDISFVTRKIQKSMAGLSILAMLASLVSFAGIASAETFPDVSSTSPYYDSVDQASDLGFMTGYDNGNFGVMDNLTKDQAAKILVLAFDYPVDTEYDAGFPDVTASNPLKDYINTAALYGIVNGNDNGTFGAGTPVNRATFATMVVGAAGLSLETEYTGYFSDVAESAWYSSYMETAYAWSIMGGYENGKGGPADMIIRGAAAKMTVSALSPVYRGADTGEEDEPAVSDGDLTVSVSDDSPESKTIPSNATSETLAAWDFTANGGDVTIDNLTVHQYGITTVPSTHQVYLYNGAERLSSGTTINASTNAATFTSNVTISEGETVTLSVRMDMGIWSSTGEIGLEIVSADKVDAGDASVDGDFSLRAAKHSVSSTLAGTLTIEKNGTIDNPQVGEDSAVISKFKLSAATEAAGVEELGLYLSGSVNTDDVENFQLYVSGADAEPIAQVDNVDSNDVIRFVMDGDFTDSTECENSTGYCLAKGGSKSFYVTADFNTGRTSDTVKVYVDQNTDIYARGNLYGSGMALTKTSYDGTTATCAATTSAGCSFSTLQGGDVTISSNGPAAADIATNSRDVSVLDFTIVSITDVVFDSFPISMDTSADTSDPTEGLLNTTGTTVTANFTDIKIVNTDTGAALFSGVDSTAFKTAQGGATAIVDTTTGDTVPSYYLYTDDFSMSPGEELNLALTMDVANTSTLDGMTFTANLDLGATYPQLKDVNNKALTNSSVLVPYAAIASKTMTVRSPSLALSKASTPGIKTYVKGTQDVAFSGLVFACGAASTCRVTDVTVQAYYDSTGGVNQFDTAYDADDTVTLNSVVGSIWLEDADGNIIADSKSVNATTLAASFTNMDWNLDAGETAVAYVHGNISTTATTQDIAFGIDSAADVTVEDADGSTFSATASGSTTGTVNAATTCTSSTDCTTAPGSYVTTAAGGTLTVAVSGSTARENIVVAGASDVEISKFEFTSTREAFTVEKLSLNNRQSASTTAALGNYDDNVVSLTVSYADEDGTTQTADGVLTGGTAQFSGLDMYVPAEGTATLTVYADLNTISDGADAGDFVDLSLAFNNFQALAESSGDTYTGGNLDATTVAAGNSLSIGTITWTDPSTLDVNVAVTALADPGAAQELKVDNASAATPVNYPVGTLLCVTTSPSACDLTTYSMLVVTQWTEGTDWTTGVDGDTVSTIVLNDADDAFADNDDIIVALPGTGFLSNTNQMVVYETKPTLALSSSSPTSANQSATEKPFYFTVSANSAQRVKVRVAQVNDATAVGGTTDFQDAALDGTFTATDSLNPTPGDVATGGIGNSAFQREVSGGTNAAGLIYTFADTTTDLSGYDGISYWCRSSSVANTLTLTIDDSAGTDATSLCTLPAVNTWTFVDKSFVGLTSTDLDAIATLTWAVTDASAENAATYDIDRIVLYTEKITIDATANDSDFDTFTDGTDSGRAANNLVGYLKEVGGTTQATGYWYSPDQTADGNDASITFYPTVSAITGTDTGIEVAAGSTKTFYLETDTVSLIDAESGVDDPVQYSIDLGTSSGGTVTAGDFFWFDDNTIVEWLGYVTATTLYSNALKY